MKMDMENNHCLQVRLRKSEDSLKIVGLCVFVFSLWSMIRTLLYVSVQWNTLYASAAEASVDGTTFTIFFSIFVSVILAVELGFRIYLARSAIAEGRGRKKRYAYIFFCFLGALLNIALMVYAVLSINRAEQTIDSALDLLLGCIAETTSICILLEMGVSAIRVKKLRARLAETG